MKLGRNEEARLVLLDGYRINPGRHRLTYLLAESNDNLGRNEDAINYYQRYLDFNPGNAERKAHARKRLEVLKPAPVVKKKSGKSNDALMKGLFKAIDTVNKEMKDFNRD